MADIVEWLRDAAARYQIAWGMDNENARRHQEAADEIERLRKIEAAYNNLVQAEKDLRRAQERFR